MSTADRVDVRGILERAGADPDAAEGSQAWALAQVSFAVGEVLAAARNVDALSIQSDAHRALHLSLRRIPGGA